MLWKRKLSIGLVWAVVSIAALVIIQRLPAVYRAETLILVDSQKIPERYVSSTVSTDLEDRLATIKQQILSGTRLKMIIHDLNLYAEERKTHVEEEILEKMRKDVSVTLERGWTGNRPGAFRIAFEGPNPTVVAQVATRIATLYIESNMKNREEQAAGTTDFIQSQLDEAQKALDRMEGQIGQYKAQHNGELPQQETMLASALSRLQTELQSNRDAVSQVQQKKMLLDNLISSDESTLSILVRAAEAGSRQSPADRAAERTTEPGRPVKQSVLLEAQLRNLRTRGLTDGHPDVRKLLAEIQRAKAAEAAQDPGPAQPAPPQPPAAGKVERPLPADAEKAVAALDPHDAAEIAKLRERISSMKLNSTIEDQEMEHLKAEERRILKDMTAFQARLEKLPIREQEMAKLTRDYQDTQALYRSLLEKKQAAEMATDLEHRQKSERFTVLDAARTPEKPVRPNRPLYNTIAILGALLVGLTFGTLREMKEDVLLGEWELPHLTPILARVPYVENIQEYSGKQRRKVVLVSSATFSLLVLLAAGVYFFSR